MNNKKEESRRHFIKTSSLGTGGLLLASQGFSIPSFGQAQKKLGIALVGLGYYSRDLLSPALQETKHSYLAGIVTGSPEKEKIWQEKYGIKKKNIYNYDNFDEIVKNKDIDIVYVVLPNKLHKEFTIRAAQAGKHVICEKPMAMNAAECREMIDACKKAGVKLSIGYRLQFEPYTQEVMRLGQEKVYGDVRYITANAGFYGRNMKGNWKAGKELGGGAMMDMGVYSLQGARLIVGEEPISVQAQAHIHRQEMFEAEETMTFQLEFPGGTFANCHTTFNANVNVLHAAAEKGWFRLDPFQYYRGLKGDSSDGPLNFPVINQQAQQMDEVALSIMNDTPMRVPGEEGLRDMIVVDAAYESVRTGKKISI